jgi:hypothetical protein
MAHKELLTMCKNVQGYNECVEALIAEGWAWWKQREKMMVKWDSSLHAKVMIQ